LALLVVIVDDLHLVRTQRGPAEADPVLAVDPYTELPTPVAAQGLEPVAWRIPQVVEVPGGVQEVELPSRHRPELPGAYAARPVGVGAVEDILGTGVPKRPDHVAVIA
jgi:hypothetical protein